MSYPGQIEFAADQAAQWSALGVKPSKALASALETYETVRWCEIGHPFELDIATLTPDNVEQKISELADYIVRAESAVPNQFTVLQKAKSRLQDAAARQVVRLAGAEAGSAAKQLVPEFNKQTKRYVEAVKLLPEEITYESILASGAEAAAAYSEATTAVKHIERVAGWVESLKVLPGQAYAAETVLHVLRPTVEQWALLQLEERKSDNQCDPALLALDPVYVVAVREGIEWGINLPAEAQELEESFALTGVFTYKVD